MAQWSEVVQILMNTNAHTATQVDPKLIKIQMQTEKGRSQDVYVGNVNDLVTFRSVVCELDGVNLDVLFQSEFVANMPYGVGPVGDYLAIKHVQILETMDIDELAGPIAELAHFADYIEGALSGGDAF
jgi:hypothetical protein